MHSAGKERRVSFLRQHGQVHSRIGGYERMYHRRGHSDVAHCRKTDYEEFQYLVLSVFFLSEEEHHSEGS